MSSPPTHSDEMTVRYRFLESTDDLRDLTLLLHRAYRPLADAGMFFLASHQDVETTRRRTEKGETIVALDQDRIIGVISVRRPGVSSGTPHYLRSDVATCGQFAVEPESQRTGIGSQLLELAEERALKSSATELALDTAETASALIEFYTKRGFRFIEYVRWEVVNYRSVVLSKVLDRTL